MKGRAGARVRRANKTAALADSLNRMPFGQPRRRFAPTDYIAPDQVDILHDASMQILERTGLEVRCPEALGIFANAGASVHETRVRIGRDIIQHAIASAPASFTLYARNPKHTLQIGEDYLTFCHVSGPPNCSDLEGGRRAGNKKDCEDFIRLSQVFNCVHTGGSACVDPIDLDATTRHLHVLRAKTRLTDKALYAPCNGQYRLRDAIEVARLGRGLTHERMVAEPSIYTVVNINSPLLLDVEMAQSMISMARLGQTVVVTPFTLAGAMAPITLAGALAQQNAEALAGIALCQLVRPGAPVVYGGFTSNVDLKSGAPAFGTPEYLKACLISGQLARRYGVPFRSSSVNSANSVDAQAGYETMFSLWGAVMSGAHMIEHAAGWLEGGLVASFEKFVMDCDLLQMLEVFLTPLKITQETLALDTIDSVGPSGHFLGTPQTLDQFATAFYAPMVSDWRTYESWSAAGRPDASQKAAVVCKAALDAFVPPEFDAETRDSVERFIARRIQEGGQCSA